jgi:hypothetical protein
VVLEVCLIAQDEHGPHSEHASVILQLRLENKGLSAVCIIVALIVVHGVVLIQVETFYWAEFLACEF